VKPKGQIHRCPIAPIPRIFKEETFDIFPVFELAICTPPHNRIDLDKIGKMENDENKAYRMLVTSSLLKLRKTG
jgi:hypothetical protein